MILSRSATYIPEGYKTLDLSLIPQHTFFPLVSHQYNLFLILHTSIFITFAPKDNFDMSNSAYSTTTNGSGKSGQANNTRSGFGTSTQATQSQGPGSTTNDVVRYKSAPDGGVPNWGLTPGTYRNIGTNREYKVGEPPRVDGSDGYPPGYVPTWGLVPGTYVNIKGGHTFTLTAAHLAVAYVPLTVRGSLPNQSSSQYGSGVNSSSGSR